MADRLTSSVRASGGDPAGMPNFKPMNLADPDKLRKLIAQSAKPALFQVWVDWVGRGTLPISPKVPRELAEKIATTIHGQILGGVEASWSNPTILPV